MKLSFFICLGAFCATPLFAEHWANRSEGDLVQVINGDYQGIPSGTQLPVFKFSSNENAEWIQVWYQGQNYSFGKSAENQNWYFVHDGNKDVVRSLGFITGLGLVAVFALAWNSRTV